MNIWAVLGIGRTTDLQAIKRAYALRLKQVNPEDDPEGFKHLRQAFEEARRQVAEGGGEDSPYKSYQQLYHEAQRARAERVAAAAQEEAAAQPASADDPVRRHHPSLERESPSDDGGQEPASTRRHHPGIGRAGSEEESGMSPPRRRHHPSLERESPSDDGGQEPASTRRHHPRIGRAGGEEESEMSPPRRRHPLFEREAPGRHPGDEGFPDVVAVARQLFERMRQPGADPVALLRALLQSPAYQNLSVRAAFEVAVIQLLEENLRELYPLASVFAAQFGWRGRASLAVRSPWDRKIAQFLSRATALAWVQAELAKPQQGARGEMLALLLLPPEPAKFRRLALWQFNRRTMRRLLLELETTQPDVIAFWINRESLEWWRQALHEHALTLDSAVLVCFLGLVGSLVPLLLLRGLEMDSPFMRVLVPIISVGIAFALDAALRTYWRKQAEGQASVVGRISRWLQSNSENRVWRRRALVSAVVVLLLGPVIARYSGQGLLVDIAMMIWVSLLMRWLYGSFSRLGGIALLALLVHPVIYFLLAPAATNFPWLATYADAWVFRHLVAMLVMPAMISAAVALLDAISPGAGSKGESRWVLVPVALLMVWLVVFSLVKGGSIPVGAYYAGVCVFAVLVVAMAARWPQVEPVIAGFFSGQKRGFSSGQARLAWARAAFRRREAWAWALPLTVALLAGSALGMTHPVGIACALASVIVLVLWVGFSVAFRTLLLLSMPMHLAQLGVVSAVLEGSGSGLDNYRWVAGHLVATWLYIAYAKLHLKIFTLMYARPPKSPESNAYWWAWALPCLVLYLTN